MNNYSYTEFLQQPTTNVKLEQGENLGTIGVFASSLLLSLGGFFAMIFTGLKNSRCKDISCCTGCIKCTRENLEEESQV
tara:strand:- start:112 stop:348 length:237 start_codon:yes stop_codon:yes gene_type:complete